MSEVIFAWPISSSFGWGLRGLGVTLNWPGIAVSASPQFDAELPPGDPRTELLKQRVSQSLNLQSQIIGPASPNIQIDAPVLCPLGNDLQPHPVAYGKWLRGKPTIACPVFEDVESVAKNIEQLKQYDAVVVASRWNREVLVGFGVKSYLCHEGVDTAIFNLSVRKVRNDGRFRVFSGGKAEYRKGQDLVIEAFKIFAEKHDDAVLVAAWGSPFSYHAGDFEGKWQYGSPPGVHIGLPNYAAWMQKAGIKPHQIELVPVMPNWRMAEVYGSVDVAVFPNRKEGGTNFVAMECMACGVPTILRLGYGHDDLADEVIQFGYTDTTDSPDRLAGLLEEAYSYGGSGDVLSAHWTWERHCKELAGIINA